jgi:hypothetical protein
LAKGARRPAASKGGPIRGINAALEAEAIAEIEALAGLGAIHDWNFEAIETAGRVLPYPLFHPPSRAKALDANPVRGARSLPSLRRVVGEPGKGASFAGILLAVHGGPGGKRMKLEGLYRELVEGGR